MKNRYTQEKHAQKMKPGRCERRAQQTPGTHANSMSPATSAFTRRSCISHGRLCEKLAAARKHSEERKYVFGTIYRPENVSHQITSQGGRYSYTSELKDAERVCSASLRAPAFSWTVGGCREASDSISRDAMTLKKKSQPFPVGFCTLSVCVSL